MLSQRCLEAGVLSKAEYDAATDELAKGTTKAAKTVYSKWRMEHAHTHYNVQPGPYGKPMFEHDMDDQMRRAELESVMHGMGEVLGTDGCCCCPC